MLGAFVGATWNGWIGCEQAVSKAEELLRLSRLRVSNGLGPGEICRSAVCFELAARMTGVRVERTKIARLSGNERAYSNAYTLLSRALPNCTPAVAPLRSLCVQFGCARIESSVGAWLDTYKRRFVASLPQERRANVHFGDRPVFQASAFYLVARKHKLRVDKVQLMEAMAIDPEEFERTLVSMQSLCGELVLTRGNSKSKKKTSDQGADATKGSSESDQDGLASDAEEVPGVTNGKAWARKRKVEEYEDWKEAVVTKKPPKLTLNKLKQATLGFSSAGETGP
mmetsp:Transcript_4086/g.25712  ORF Transcript_4086/g.25712 Transcript_4086/m.25712 type:complete len:283 (-) Transcript_4086:1634-2482(-)